MGNFVTIKELTYGQLGHIGTSTVGDNLLSVEYGYDVQGRLSSTSSPVFNESVTYETASGSLSGNVNSISWNYGENHPQSGSVSYEYDSLDRLISAKKPSGSSILAQYSYDLNCNPTHIRRYGVSEVLDDSIEWGEIDDVSITYSGNQRQSATDSRPALVYNGANDFPSGTSEYTWDDNGNMLSDSGSGITAITYNRLNQPTHIDLGTKGEVFFTYDAQGRKLSMRSATKLSINPLAENTAYALSDKLEPFNPPVMAFEFFTLNYYDNITYRGSNLERIHIPGGYITKESSGYVYHFTVADRQGNVRVVVKAGSDGSPIIEEANDYYPYGMLMTNTDGTYPNRQPHKFSGKEYLTPQGLSLYDFGPRHHSPWGISFNTQDPLSENSPQLSPYIYCNCNPVKNIDPSGLRAYNIDAHGNYLGIDESVTDDVINIFYFKGQPTMSLNLGVGAIEDHFSGRCTLSKKDSTLYPFDYFTIYGDENAIFTFIVMGLITDVEWSLALTGEASDGLGFLSTAHMIAAEPGMTHLFNTQLIEGYFLRVFLHNHVKDKGTPNPSKDDINFAKNVIKNYRLKNKYKNDLQFMLFIPGAPFPFLQFGPDSEKSDFDKYRKIEEERRQNSQKKSQQL